MRAWGESTGEALHTSTFLGHPVGCAMGVAAIREMQARQLDQVAAAKGERLMAMLRPLAERHRRVGDVRGRGLMVGVELVKDRKTKEPDRQTAWQVVLGALRRGLILLGGGQRRNVLSISPPLTIADPQLDFLARTIDECLKELS
jgi:4-aminobutyrate aminotransferase-like enzyme